MNMSPVITIKRKETPDSGVRWYVIIRGEIYEPARLATTAPTLGQALSVAEAHLRWWGYNEIEVTRALANAYRSLRRRYGAGIMLEPSSPAQRAAADQLEPYPD